MLQTHLHVHIYRCYHSNQDITSTKMLINGWVDEELRQIHKETLLSHREELNCIICRKMDRTGCHHAKQSR